MCSFERPASRLAICSTNPRGKKAQAGVTATLVVNIAWLGLAGVP